jgi:tRNA nucleotidyltransferase/poly(A) polymerase
MELKIEINTDQRLTEAVKRTTDEHQYAEEVYKIIKKLDGINSFLCGGSVRDPIVKVMYGTENRINDFDFLVDDSKEKIDFKKLFPECKTYTRFGSPKLKPFQDLTIDIFPFSNATTLKKIKASVSLETFLKSVHITTSAIAYNLKENKIYSCEGLEDIRKKQVDILYSQGETKPALMATLILHSEKLDFRLGQKAKDFI